MYIYDLKELIEFCQNIKVLFVKNNAEDRQSALDIFNIFFSHIDYASNGREGLELFKQNKYDLIITGIIMPELNGIEFISKVREISNHKSILVISSDQEKKHFIDLIKLGIDGYIAQPIDIEQFTSVLQRTMEKIKEDHELFEYRKELEKKVEEELEKRLDSERKLVQQSKLAAMGEMMDAVAHQWKQPINTMSMQVDMLQYLYEDGDLDLKEIKAFQVKFNKQKDHILSTLQGFRDFFRPNKSKERFYIKHCIDSVLLLVKDEFVKNRIEFVLDIKDDFEIDAIENEFKHTILNIINNSKDAFNENDISNRRIMIRAIKCKKKNILMIQDNAGGIPKDIIDDIFKANVTSKTEGRGTGIGLYMTDQIVQKAFGSIKVKNSIKRDQKGAKFYIKLPA